MLTSVIMANCHRCDGLPWEDVLILDSQVIPGRGKMILQKLIKPQERLSLDMWETRQKLR